MSLMQRYMLLFTAAAVAALVAAPAHAQATTGGGSPRARCGGCATTLKDSSRIRRERLLLKFDSLRYGFEHQRMSEAERERLADEMHRTFMALQESLDDVTIRSRTFVTTPEGAELTRDGMRTAPEIAIAVQSGFRRQRCGYLGVTFDGPGTEIRRGCERIIRFLDYPRIALVEPSSPAERAGIEEGDTLLALNGIDVREREISLTKLLVPNQTVVVRVRREGNAKDFRVTIKEAPGYVMSRMVPMVPMAPMAPMSPMAVRVYPGEVLPRAPIPPVPAVAGTPSTQSVWIINEAIGGAKLESISEGLGKALGTKSGVLVLRAVPGSPAYESGLRDGDVILKAAGTSVSSVRELRALVDGAHDEGVKLGILRERKQREVVLRW
jgi:hypothetical protein